MSARCICGCRRRGHQRHHAVYAQHLEREHRKDRRNLVPVHHECHAAHHGRSKPLRLAMLPDSVFDFASEVFGPQKAYNYLSRYYAGPDERLRELVVA